MWYDFAPNSMHVKASAALPSCAVQAHRAFTIQPQPHHEHTTVMNHRGGACIAHCHGTSDTPTGPLALLSFLLPFSLCPFALSVLRGAHDDYLTTTGDPTPEGCASVTGCSSAGLFLAIPLGLYRVLSREEQHRGGQSDPAMGRPVVPDAHAAADTPLSFALCDCANIYPQSSLHDTHDALLIALVCFLNFS
jgi:hypothetical protein